MLQQINLKLLWKIANPAKNSEELLENNTVSESKAKSKGKKKSKKSSDCPAQSKQVQSLTMKKQVDNTVCEEGTSWLTKVRTRNNVDQEKLESLQLVVVEQSKDSASALCNGKKRKKSSMKRKRLASDGEEYHPDDIEAIEESKRRKSAALKE